MSDSLLSTDLAKVLQHVEAESASDLEQGDKSSANDNPASPEFKGSATYEIASSKEKGKAL